MDVLLVVPLFLLGHSWRELTTSRSRQRLEDEYDSNVIVTAPTVPYKGKTRSSMYCTYH
jgi:translation elongation factor EF-4